MLSISHCLQTPCFPTPLLLFFILLATSVPNPNSGPNTIEGSLVRLKRQYSDGPDPFHSLGGVNEDGHPRSPLILEVTQNLTLANGPNGRCGVCARTYRVLKDIQYKPSVECQRYMNSRQAALGDLTEFYHLLYNSHKQKETLTFMLSDSFPEFAFAASFMTSSPNVPPFLMLETAKSAEQVLCVQSHRCPEPTTTTTTTTTTSPLPYIPPVKPLLLTASQQIVDKSMSPSSRPNQSPNFWDAIMINSSPQIWVIATLVLACASFILFIILICTCIWIFHTKRSYRRKRCRGTCRFGCKCTPDTIRQAAADAACIGLVGAQANAPMITYPSVGHTWGLSNSTKGPLNQLYVALAANDKMLGTQGSGTPPSQQMFPLGQVYPGENWPQHQRSYQKSMATKESMWRSHSDGSSISDHTVPSAVGSGPPALRNLPSRSSGQPATAYAYNANPSSATPSTCMQSYVGAVSGQGGSGPTERHLGSPMRFEDGQNGFNSNDTPTQPVELRGVNGGLYDHSLGEMGNTFAHQGELTNITPPAGFYDLHGKTTTTSKLEQSWTYGSQLSGVAKVYPSDAAQVTKQMVSNSPADYKRQNGLLTGGEVPLEDLSTRRPCGGITSHILSHPLAEGVEQNYSYNGNSDNSLRLWTNSLAH